MNDGFKIQSNSMKWQNKQEKNYLFRLTIADFDIALYSPFKQALLSITNSITDLTYKNPNQQYYQSIINWYHQEYQFNLIKPQYIVTAPSVVQIYGVCVLAFTQPNESILLMTPGYKVLIESARTLGRNVIETRLKIKSNSQNMPIYDIDFEDIEQKCKNNKCKIMVVCNPHNPSGRIWNEQELNRIVLISKKYNMIIFSDQIYADMILNKKKFKTMLHWDYQNMIIVNSLSKTFGIPAIQTGYGIIKQVSMRQKYLNISNAFKFFLNQYSYKFTTILYGQVGRKWIVLINQLIHSNYKMLLQFKNIKRPGLIIMGMDAGFLVVVDFVNYIKDMRQLEKRLQRFAIELYSLEKCYYPPQQTTQMRVAIGVQQNYFQQFLKALNQALEYRPNL